LLVLAEIPVLVNGSLALRGALRIWARGPGGHACVCGIPGAALLRLADREADRTRQHARGSDRADAHRTGVVHHPGRAHGDPVPAARKSTRLKSRPVKIGYAVLCMQI